MSVDAWVDRLLDMGLNADAACWSIMPAQFMIISRYSGPGAMGGFLGGGHSYVDCSAASLRFGCGISGNSDGNGCGLAGVNAGEASRLCELLLKYVPPTDKHYHSSKWQVIYEAHSD